MTLRQVVRFTRRDLRGAPWQSLGVILSLAAAVASVYLAVACLSSFRAFLLGGSRQWLGADLQVVLDSVPQPEDLAALPPEMARSTAVIETLANASSPFTGISAPVLLKAVDPSGYPLYSPVQLKPDQPLRDGQVAVSPELLTDLGAKPGGLLTINGHDFTIAATIFREPDRFAASPYTFHRVLLTRTSLDASDVLRRGNSLNARLLFALRNPADLTAARALLEQRYPDADIADYHQPDPRNAQSIDSAGFFMTIGLSLVLLASFVACALLLHLQLDSHLDTVAVLKVLGAGSRQLLALAAAYTTALVGSACLLGLAAGELGARLTLPLFERWFLLQLPAPRLAPVLGWSLSACLLAAALLFLRNSVFSLHVRPLRLFRRYFERTRKPWLRPGRHRASTVCSLAAGSALVVLISVLELGLAPAFSNALLDPESNLGLVSHPEQQFQQLRRWLDQHPELPRIDRTYPVVRLRLLSINGRPSLADRMWWTNCHEDGSVRSGEAVISPAQAYTLGVEPGSTLEFHLPQRTLRVRIARLEDRHTLMQSTVGIDLACADVRDAHILVYVTFRVDRAHTPAFRHELSKAFPTLIHISREEATEVGQEVLDHGLLLVRAGFAAVALCCGVIMVLIAAAEARLRLSETAILRVLGASRSRLLRRALWHYGLAGAVAGGIGGLSGAAAARLLIQRLVHATGAWADYTPAVAAVPMTALVAVCAGWWATRRALRVRPMETLREQ